MFLDWAQNHEPDVVLAATANNLSVITDNFPEMLRAERFDAMFMFDLPGDKARTSMWDYYIDKFSAKAEDVKRLTARSTNWTGAEIRACCRIASMRGVTCEEQLELIPVIYKVAKDTIDSVRVYANGKFICASTGKLYAPMEEESKPARKALKRVSRAN